MKKGNKVTLTTKIPSLQSRYLNQKGIILHVFKNEDIAVRFNTGKSVISQPGNFTLTSELKKQTEEDSKENKNEEIIND